MLSDVRNGLFMPDSTRSGYFVSKRAKPAVLLPTSKAKPKMHTIHEDQEGDDDGHVSNESEVSSDNEAELSENERLAKYVGNNHDSFRQPAKGASEDFVLHKRWMTVHKPKKDLPTRTTCGRVINDSYMHISSDLEFTYHRCGVCFGRTTEVL
jgi:hypothetical protein